MQSHRLNRKGETIPSVKEPYVYTGGVQHHYPYGGRRNLACAYGCDDSAIEGMDDDEFSAYNQNMRRRAATVLAQETSLGRDSTRTTAAILRQSKNQADLNLFLTQNNKWAIGDRISYTGIPEGSPNLTLGSCGVIIATERTLEKVNWNEMEGEFRPFLVLQLHPLKWIMDHPDEEVSDFNKKFHARWTSCRYNRHLSTNEYAQLFKDNVQLSNYLQQAKDALKAGLVEISG